jgi:hypothetical protein
VPPSLGALRPDAPPALVAAIERCLRKRPDDRWATADDFRQALSRQAIEPAGIGVTEAAHLREPISMWTVAAIAIAGALAAVIADRLLGAGGILGIGGVAAAAFAAAITIAGRRLERQAMDDGRPDRSTQRLRADRAAVIAILTRVPRTEREALTPVRRAMDDLVARAAESERLSASAPADEDANIQRAVHEQNLVRYRTASGQLRRCVRNVWSDGYARAATEVDRALAGYAEAVRRDT